MDDSLGEALRGFHAEFEGLRDALYPFPALAARCFAHTDEWHKLLVYKLLPHLGGETCLVAAVAGGTNTGKSTVFNLLLGRDCSPVRTTAAATCRPVAAASPSRGRECLRGELLPEFQPQILEDPEALVSGYAPENALFVVQAEDLPDNLIFLDIPDVDSIDKQNWEVAENIQAAGDVLIAILTGEKYKDDRVIAFFRRAHAAGRLILPLMNKANPENDFEVARAQMDDFAQEVGFIPEVRFAIPHDFSISKNLDRPIEGIDAQAPLRAYLEQLDTVAVKQRVYRDSVAHFVSQSEDFIAQAEELRTEFTHIVRTFEHRARECAQRHDPQPDEKVGALLHEYIRERRGAISRAVGEIGGRMARNWSPVGQWVKQAIASRMALERGEKKPEKDGLAEVQSAQLQTLTYSFVHGLIHDARNLPEPARSFVSKALDFLDVDEAVEHIAADCVSQEELSRGFREHVHDTLALWWEEHQVRRVFLQELDALLILSPAAIAVPLAVYTAGVGVPEAITAVSPLAGAFFSRVMEHQLADRWFDLLAPWRKERQDRYKEALEKHILTPCLEGLRGPLEALNEETLETLRRHREQCQKAC